MHSNLVSDPMLFELTRSRLNLVSIIFLLAFSCIAKSGLAQEPFTEPREVKLGIAIMDITEVDDASQAFFADIFLAVSWQDDDLASKSEEQQVYDLNDVWSPTLVIYNQRSVSESLPEEVVVKPNGTVTYLQRFTGLFSVPMDLREFPRDRQDFFIWVVAPVRAKANVTLIPDQSLPVLRAEKFSISDWKFGEAILTQEALQLASGAPTNPGIKLTVTGTRQVSYYIIQVLIPLFAIVMMAYAVFWIAPTVVPTRIGVAVSTMLTLIAYRFMLANYVPKLPYLTLLDWFLLGSTIIVVLTLFTMAGTSYLIRHDKEVIVNRIDRFGRLLFPVVFVIYLIIVWL